MMNVVFKKSLFPIFAMLAFAGCKEPDVQMGSLGKRLAAPTLVGTSPFDQDFSGLNYARLQGTCDTRVGSILISFDKITWHQPPATPDMTSTALAAGTQNDTTCSDGGFDVYITKTDLAQIWNLTSSNEINTMYLKGSTVIGDTEILTLVNSHSPSDGDGTDDNPTNDDSPTTTKIVLEKSWPRGFAGSGQCQNLYIYLQSGSGYRTTHTSDVTFKIGKSDVVAGTNTSSSTIFAYKNWSDCNSSTNASDTFKIPAGQTSTEIIYRFPESPIDGVLSFKVQNVSALTPDETGISVTLRSSSDTTRRWLALDEPIHQIYKNKCYPFRIRAYNYTNSWSNEQAGDSLEVVPTDSRVKFYSSSACDSASLKTTFAFPGSGISDASLIAGFFQFEPNGTETDQFIPFEVSLRGIQGNVYNYDVLPFNFRADLSSNSTATKLDIWGPQYMENGSCNSFRIVSMNSNGTRLPAANSFSVNLATQEANVGTFYATESCYAGNEISTTSFAANELSKVVYFRAAASSAGLYHFNLSASGMSSQARELNIVSVPNKVQFDNPKLYTGTCSKVTVKLYDGAGVSMAAPSPLTVMVSFVWNDYSTTGRLFADSACTQGSSILSLETGMRSVDFYVHTNALGTSSLGGILSVYQYYTGSGPSVSGDTISGLQLQ